MSVLNSKLIRGTVAVCGMVIIVGVSHAQEPLNSLVVDENGKIGIGTAAPTHSVHVQNVDPLLRIENTNDTKGSRDILRLENKGAVNFKLRDLFMPGVDGEWTFRTDQNGAAFVIGKTTSGVTEFRAYSGGNLEIAGNLSEGSSREIKENIAEADARSVLDKVLQLPVSKWNYKHDGDDVQHIGPMAEDFHTIFGVGSSPKRISAIDTGGVALAAIKGLNEVVKEKDAEIANLREELDELRDLIHSVLGKGSVVLN